MSRIANLREHLAGWADVAHIIGLLGTLCSRGKGVLCMNPQLIP